jgi:[ribosomal protein S18]-alanine N-acetyltransferase
MSGVRIRPIDSSHIGDLIRIAEDTNLNRWTAAHYVDELKNDQSIMLRLESEENGTVGFIVGRIVPAADSDVAIDADIYNIGIEPGLKRRGFGQLLFDALVDVCREKLVRRIWLEVRETNFPAIRFYERNGFQSVTIRSDFYSNPRENGVVMRCDL